MGNNNCFWSHEWNKHGTCISNLDPSCTSNPVKGKDKYSYFSKGLELRAKFDLFKALAAKMIFPSQSKRFWTEDVRDAIKAEFDVDPGLYCKNGTLHEVWLYFKVKNRDQQLFSWIMALHASFLLQASCIRIKGFSNEHDSGSGASVFGNSRLA
ncbi:Ribonuclease T2 precursor (RNase T2) [Podila epicladia]|nr:Ribonuclease T2 precursor (RNase T2) [Podila epicladia]